MKGFRRVPKSNPGGRRFKDSRDDKHRQAVKRLPCLIAGKRSTITKWVGTFPKVKQEIEVVHVCSDVTDPHHTKKKSQGGHDRSCVPLCRSAHDMAERMTNQEFLDVWKIDLALEAERLAVPPKQDPTP